MRVDSVRHQNFDISSVAYNFAHDRTQN